MAVITSSCPGASPSPARTATSARRSRFCSNSGVCVDWPLGCVVVVELIVMIITLGVAPWQCAESERPLGIIIPPRRLETTGTIAWSWTCTSLSRFGGRRATLRGAYPPSSLQQHENTGTGCCEECAARDAWIWRVAGRVRLYGRGAWGSHNTLAYKHSSVNR